MSGELYFKEQTTTTTPAAGYLSLYSKTDDILYYKNSSGVEKPILSFSATNTNKQVQFNDSGVIAGAASLYWDKTGEKLGIGASSPETTLHVVQPYAKTNTAETSALFVSSNDSSAKAGMVLSIIGGASQADRVIAVNGLESGVAYGGKLALMTQGGYVGIGTTAPESPLHVITPYAKNDTTNRYPLFISSNDSSAKAGVLVGIKGGASQAVREFTIDGYESGSSFGGCLVLMGQGGTVGVGVSAPLSKFAVNGVGNSAYAAHIGGATSDDTAYSLVLAKADNSVLFSMRNDGIGTISASTWYYNSDLRLKENINYLARSEMDNIMALKPAAFDYIDGIKNEVGFIAQDVQTVYPNLVATGMNGMYSLKTTNLLPYIVKAIQELNNRLLALEA
jgi:hypothetical protein